MGHRALASPDTNNALPLKTMTTPDPTNVLFKIAHPDLYARNPFNLLNLPIDATAKDIRRRQAEKSPSSLSVPLVVLLR